MPSLFFCLLLIIIPLGYSAKTAPSNATAAGRGGGGGGAEVRYAGAQMNLQKYTKWQGSAEDGYGRVFYIGWERKKGGGGLVSFFFLFELGASGFFCLAPKFRTLFS